MGRATTVVGMLAMALGVLLASRGQADTVTSQVRGYTDRALEVLGDSSLSVAQRETALRTIARQLFD